MFTPHSTAFAGRHSCRAFPTTRRAITAGAAFAVLGAASRPADAGVGHALDANDDDRRAWDTFKLRFLAPDGRVVDTGNNGCSHTEGQGVGMLVAVAMDDQPAFDMMACFTARHMRRASDALHAWRYLPGRAVPCPDQNNATDGDLLIAAALWRAARRWGRPDAAQVAGSIGRAVLDRLVRDVGGRTVLLPGADGFETPHAVAVNPSYYAFPLMSELAQAAPSPVWDRLRSHGLDLIDQGRFGRWRLPPDWLRVARSDGTLTPHPQWPARFSYDAIRVPLWLGWSRLSTDSIAASFSAWARARDVPPAWVDLQTDVTASYDMSVGMMSALNIATAAQHETTNQGRIAGASALRASPDYYSAALVLLSRLARLEGRVA